CSRYDDIAAAVYYFDSW
nr:immunoglobulin heavy chain junction region [Macaca mulatta]